MNQVFLYQAATLFITVPIAIVLIASESWLVAGIVAAILSSLSSFFGWINGIFSTRHLVKQQQKHPKKYAREAKGHG